MTLFRTPVSSRPAPFLKGLGVAIVVALVLAAVWLRPAYASLQRMSDLDVLQLISESKGKVTVINFFASWCGPCRLEIPELIELRKKYPMDDVVVVGLAVDDTKDALQAMSDEVGFNYPVYLAESSAAKLFNVEGVPMVLVYAPDGKLITTQVGYRPGYVEQLVEEHLPK